MKLDEARRRDAIIRPYLLRRDWDASGERRLVRNLVTRSAELLPEYPYVVDYEWEASCDAVDEGYGDLLFADGAGRLAVVEVKRVSGVSRPGPHRRTVERQGQKFARVARLKWPDCDVAALVFTDDPHEAYAELRPAAKPAGMNFG